MIYSPPIQQSDWSEFTTMVQASIDTIALIVHNTDARPSACGIVLHRVKLLQLFFIRHMNAMQGNAGIATLEFQCAATIINASQPQHNSKFCIIL